MTLLGFWGTHYQLPKIPHSGNRRQKPQSTINSNDNRDITKTTANERCDNLYPVWKFERVLSNPSEKGLLLWKNSSDGQKIF